MSIYIQHIIRGFIILLIQISVFKNLSWDFHGFNYLVVLIYPLIFALLPFQINKVWLVILSFLVGLGVDFFYDSPGVHASAMLLMSYTRILIVKWLEPRGGYTVHQNPTLYHQGFQWTMRYMLSLFTIHHLWYFSMLSFTLFYFDQILLHTILSLLVDIPLVFILLFLFNPKY